MVNARFDRTMIVPLLREQFPELVGKSSDEVHAFLNQYTGSQVSVNEPNGSAFDHWRKALALLGHEGIWRLSPEQEATIKKRSVELEAEQARLREKFVEPLVKAERPFKPVDKVGDAN